MATFKSFGVDGEISSAFSYNVICRNNIENGWIRHYEYDFSSGPYVVNGTTWAGYDDLQSIRQKAIMIKKVDHGGVH